MSNVRPDPAPTTWMIEAHSAFFSTSATVAFCTFRILPRIGSSAWNSESRASLAVPSAESPSTMNSSERSTSLDRQSASFAGSAEDSSAFLRRWVSRCWRAASRVFAAPATFSMTSLACAFSARLVEVRKLFSSAATTLRTTDRAAGVPSTSLVWPSNCGSASRTVTTAVRPSSTSSLTTSVSLALSTREPRIDVVERLGQRGLEAGHVGAALGGRDHVDERAQLGLVAGPPAQRHVDVQLALDVLRGHVPLVVEQRHRLGERVRALQPEHFGDRLVVAEERRRTR